MLDVHQSQPVHVSYPPAELAQPSPRGSRGPGELGWLSQHLDPSSRQPGARPSATFLRTVSPYGQPPSRSSPGAGRAQRVTDMHDDDARIGQSAVSHTGSFPSYYPSMMGPSTYTPGGPNSSYHPHGQRMHQFVDPGSRSRIPSKPASPVPPHAQPPEQTSVSKHPSLQPNPVAEYLQLPESISKTHGSLAEFAAQITCLFWFESSSTLSFIEDSDQTPFPTSRLVSDAFPATGFLKWVTTILSTTQVSQVVILLALLFVYRLKKQNPSVRGKPGSEYRLLTVALMLGNKFLDDNTYTNKTWAEVSGISVHEIHVMEVEFLSHMKYNLYTSGEEWRGWHEKLAKFWTYFDLASRKLGDVKSLDLRVPNLHMPQALPSPPASHSASPPFVSSTSPSPAGHQNSQNLPPQLAPIPGFATSQLPEMDPRIVNGRKRSYDEALKEPPVKRAYPYNPTVPVGSTPQHSQQPLPNLPNLPMPHLPLPGTQVVQSRANTPGSQMALSGGRNTPSASAPSTNWLQGVYQNTAYAPPQSESFTAPQNHLITSRQNTPIPPNPTSSITSSYPSSASHTGNPNKLSPSHFLIQRTSPYRPVRNISTLLVPPPSSSIDNPSNAISYEQMHWQPLSKYPNERRTGRVPYIHHGGWAPPAQQMTPYHVYPHRMPGQ